MYPVFLEIAEQLNRIGITPTLMGSVGLEQCTGRSWSARDLDIHVPGHPDGWAVSDDQRIYQAQAIITVMANLGFTFTDPHEFAFYRDGVEVEYAGIDTLPAFADVALADLPLCQDGAVCYYLPNAEQFLKIYQASSKDSYRADQNNYKDLAKISYLENLLRKTME